MSISDAAPISEPASVAPSEQQGRFRDFIRQVDKCRNQGVPLFFFGSKPEIVYAVRDKITADFPALAVVGICDADFHGAVSHSVVRHIVALRPGLIVTDMAEQDFAAFAQSMRAHFLPDQLANFPGAFRAYARPARTILPIWARLMPLGRWSGAGGEGSSALRFTRVVLVQLLRNLAPKLRFVRAGAASQRD